MPDLMPEPLRYTPLWTTDRRPPRLANGDLLGTVGEDDAWAAIMLRMGSATTCGTGVWRITCPIPAALTTGGAVALDSDTGTVWGIATEVTDGTVTLLASSDMEPITSVHPFTWAPGDELRILVGDFPADWDLLQRFQVTGLW